MISVHVLQRSLLAAAQSMQNDVNCCALPLLSSRSNLCGSKARHESLETTISPLETTMRRDNNE